MVIERKLNLFGHICRMRLVKIIMFGQMDGVGGKPHRE